MMKLTPVWTRRLLDEPETGMGYQIVTVTLRNGDRYNQVVVNSGYITRVRNFSEIPFAESDIADITVTHDKWDFNKERQGVGR